MALPVITYSKLLEVIGGHRRPLIEGEAIFNSKHLICVGIRKNTSTELGVFSLCLQSSNVSEGKPHEVEIQIVKENDSVKCKCSCKAGASERCKHIAAVLIYLNRHALEDLEEMGQTDLRQEWGKLKRKALENYTSRPIKMFCHVRAPLKLRNQVSTEIDLEGWRRQFVTAFPNSELGRVASSARSATDRSVNFEKEAEKENHPLDEILDIISKTQGNSQGIVMQMQPLADAFLMTLDKSEAEYFDKNISITEDERKNICFRTVDQKGFDWMCARKGRITGTTCYQVMTYTKNKNPDWGSKLESIFKSKFYGNKATRHGMECEPKAIKEYEKKNGVTVIRTGLITCPQLPWLAFSPDGIVKLASGKLRLIEVKSPMEGQEMTAENCYKTSRYFDKKTNCLKKKHPYYGQIMLGLALLGSPECHLVIYSSYDSSIFVEKIEYDSLFVKEMIELLCGVYFSKALPWLTKNIAICKKQ